MIGYKCAFIYTNNTNDVTRVLVKIVIPNDAKTNINRPNLYNKDKARFRTNKCKVISISSVDNDNEIYGMEIGPLPKSYNNSMVREDFENFFIKIRNELRTKKLERILEI